MCNCNRRTLAQYKELAKKTKEISNEDSCVYKKAYNKSYGVAPLLFAEEREYEIVWSTLQDY